MKFYIYSIINFQTVDGVGSIKKNKISVKNNGNFHNEEH